MSALNAFVEADSLGMYAIAKRNPQLWEKFSHLAHEIMHEPGALAPLHRELVGAHVSRASGCDFCHRSHRETVIALGGPEASDLLDEPSAEVQVLFETADQIMAQSLSDAQVERFLGAGFLEAALEEVIFVCALFGFANRMVSGFRISYDPKRDEASSRGLAAGYRRT